MTWQYGGSMGISTQLLKYVAFAPCSSRDSGCRALCRRWKVIRMGRRVSFFSQKLRSASVVLSHVSHRLCKWQDTNRLPLAAFCQQDGANEMGMKRATWKKYFTNKFACRSKVSLRWRKLQEPERRKVGEQNKTADETLHSSKQMDAMRWNLSDILYLGNNQASAVLIEAAAACPGWNALCQCRAVASRGAKSFAPGMHYAKQHGAYGILIFSMCARKNMNVHFHCTIIAVWI